MKKYNILKWVVLIVSVAINVFIIVNACINGAASSVESNNVAHAAANVVNSVQPETVTEQNFPQFAFSIRKLLGHFGLFAASGFFSTWSIYLCTKNTKISRFYFQILITILFGILLAFLSEFLQKFTDGRTAAIKDVGIDSAGYFIGLICIQIVLFVYNLGKKAK